MRYLVFFFFILLTIALGYFAINSEIKTSKFNDIVKEDIDYIALSCAKDFRGKAEEKVIRFILNREKLELYDPDGAPDYLEPEITIFMLDGNTYNVGFSIEARMQQTVMHINQKGWVFGPFDGAEIFKFVHSKCFGYKSYREKVDKMYNKLIKVTPGGAPH